MNKSKTLVVMFILCFFGLGAQVEKKYSLEENAPDWIQLMYQTEADPGLVQEAFESYYAIHPFEKNEHTQYYKRWMKSQMRNATPVSGSQSSTYWVENQANYMNQTAQLAAHRGGLGNWSSIGPFDFDLGAEDRSYAAGAAHVYTVEQSLSNSSILYAGTANAGVWYSSNKGLTWTPTTTDMLIKTVYSVEIDPLNPAIAYFGGNDGQLYKTFNSGDSWSVIGDANFTSNNHEIRDLVIAPDNNQELLIASTQGLYKSTDGGNNMTQVLTGEIQEIEYHPTNPQIVYAVRLSNDKTQFYKSTDGGNNFTIYTSGWPNPGANEEQKRTEIAVSPDAPNRVYALATGSANFSSGLYGIYVSNDAGETWSFTCCGPQPGGMPSANNINLMGWDDLGQDAGGQYYYDLAFAVSPTNADSVFVGGVNLWVSGDGGSSFVCPSKWSHSYKPNYVHADIHDIRFFDNDLWIANDGGIFYSNDAGANFEPRQYGIEGTDFWGFGAGYWDGDVMLGGTYHNGTLLKDNDVFINGWISTDGGDNDRGFVNPGNQRVVYSDYDRKELSGDRTVAAATYPYGNKPNTGGAGRESELVFDPDCYTCFYTGFEEGLWYTKDDGSSYELIYEFDDFVGEIEIPWSNTNIIYLTTFDGFYGDKKIWKSEDKGVNWTEITIPSNMLNGFTSRPYVITANNQNPNELFVGRVGYFEALDGYKIYHSTDGGNTYSNITSNSLDGELITNITMQQGTDGGVWMATRRTVFYKNNSMTDWQLYNIDLPASTYSTRLVPHYRTSSIRNASDRSVYEAPFIENSTVQAQISVASKTLACTSDTAYFADHSVLSENGATWNWQFPGGLPASSTERTPKVVYPNPGTYSVLLTVSNVTGTSSQAYTDFITVNNGCAADTVPGLTAQMVASGDYLTLPSLDVTTNTFSTSAWIKPSEVLNEYSAIVLGGDAQTGGLNVRANMELAYHWPGGQWWWESGLFVPVGEWSHVALSVSPSSVTVYLNGVGATHTVNTDSVDLVSATYIGSYRGWASRNFIGEIDEVCIWDKTLTQNDVREQMHLTKKPVDDPNLIAYYQFNNLNGMATDRSNGRHATFSGNATRTTSTAPVGGGVSDRITIGSAGVYQTVNTGTELNIAGSLTPDGEIVVSRLDIVPNLLPAPFPSSQRYWIINNYGNNDTFDAIDEIKFDGHRYVSESDAASADSFYLYQRAFNGFINNWDSLGHAVSAIAGTPGSVSFDNQTNITNFGQFVILNKGLTINPLPSSISELPALQHSRVFPNPIAGGSELMVVTEVKQLTFQLFDNNGRLLLEKPVMNGKTIEVPNMQQGIYFYRLRTEKYMTHGKLMIQ